MSSDQIVEGTDPGGGIPRRSIVKSEKIPNVAIFARRTALEFLKVIFSTRAEGSLRYDPEDTKTDIQITDIHAVNLKTVGLRPAIIGIRGPLTVQGLGFGNVQSRSINTGGYTFSDLLTGSVALSCISREGIEAENIGHIVFNSFKYFRPILQKYGYFTIKSLSLGAEQLIESEGADDRTTLVPVYVNAQIQDRWKLDPIVENKLREIIIENAFTP